MWKKGEGSNYMAGRLMKYKGQYRILPEIDKETNDLPRTESGEIDPTYDDIYISCQYGNRIFWYGRFPHKRQVWLIAYIPSIGRGRNIKKALNKQGIEICNYKESDEEVEFLFRDEDIDFVANLLHAKTAGANISPFSTKNLPKSNYALTEEQMYQYKNAISNVNMIEIKNANTLFLQKMEQDIKKKDKSFDRINDMKKLCMSRQVKEYIAYKGLWDQYITFISEYFANEE